MRSNTLIQREAENFGKKAARRADGLKESSSLGAAFS